MANVPASVDVITTLGVESLPGVATAIDSETFGATVSIVNGAMVTGKLELPVESATVNEQPEYKPSAKSTKVVGVVNLMLLEPTDAFVYVEPHVPAILTVPASLDVKVSIGCGLLPMAITPEVIATIGAVISFTVIVTTATADVAPLLS